VKLLGRKRSADAAAASGATTGATSDEIASVAATSDDDASRGSRKTDPKGRPTPKRSDATKRQKGPVVPAPMTASEARARRKALGRPKLSREERRVEMVDAKFPSNTESHWKLGIYAAGRATQMRRMRAPRPQVERGSLLKKSPKAV
jgi:hypothetical protein